MTDEIWRAIPEVNTYSISNLGRVMNNSTGKILNQHIIGKTPVVNMQKAGKAICRSVPKLVKELF